MQFDGFSKKKIISFNTKGRGNAYEANLRKNSNIKVLNTVHICSKIPLFLHPQAT